jgi:hypothetical protein
MKTIFTIALLLSAIFSYGQRLPVMMDGGRRKFYDTVPSLLQISDTAVDAFVRGYRGFVVYENEYVESYVGGYFREPPQIFAYLRNDTTPLSKHYFVWQNKDLRQCILQPIKGL